MISSLLLLLGCCCMTTILSCHAFIIAPPYKTQQQRRSRSSSGHNNGDPAAVVALSATSNSKSKSSPAVNTENWIEKVSSSPDNTNNEWEEYNLGINGLSLETGPLSKKFYQAMISNSRSNTENDEEMIQSYKLLAMDFTAREATRVSCEQNGFIILEEEEWGKIEQIQLIDNKGRPMGKVYDSWFDMVDMWKPGLGFHFVVKGVKAKGMEYDLQDVLSGLDPDGLMTKQAEEKGMALPTEDLQSLKDLSNDCKRRCEETTPPPVEEQEESVFAGDARKGYNPIRASDLMVSPIDDASRYEKTLMHVMDAWVSHSCLIVELDDEKDIMALHQMWQKKSTPEADDTPEDDDAQTSVLSRLGGQIIQIATAASSVEHDGYSNDEDAFQAAQRMVRELVVDDDGPTTISRTTKELLFDDAVARTDTSFATIIPVASLSSSSSLEVWDEDVREWYRPELKARRAWEQKKEKETATTDTDITIPWHARYVIVMPGELLQIVSRNEIASAVHRFVTTTTPAEDQQQRHLLASILLRGRPEVPLKVSKYLAVNDSNNHDALLQQVDGMYLQDIYNVLNPSTTK